MGNVVVFSSEKGNDMEGNNIFLEIMQKYNLNVLFYFKATISENFKKKEENPTNMI